MVAARRLFAVEGHTKGVVIRELLLWWQRNRDHLAVMRIAEHGSGSHLRRHIDVTREGAGILPSAWYPCELLHEIIDFLTRELPPRERQALARRVGAEGMAESLRTIYRPITGMMQSPEQYARHVQRFWNQRFDTGTVESTSSRPGEHTIEVRGWTSHHPFSCLAHAAAQEAVYEFMACRDIRASVETCVTAGAEACRVHVHWNAGGGGPPFSSGRLRVAP